MTSSAGLLGLWLEAEEAYRREVEAAFPTNERSLFPTPDVLERITELRDAADQLRQQYQTVALSGG